MAAHSEEQQPLLLALDVPSTAPAREQEHPHHAGSLQPIAPTVLFNAKRTKRTDLAWGFAYFVLAGTCLLGGFAVLAHLGSSEDNVGSAANPVLLIAGSLTCNVQDFNAAWPAFDASTASKGSSGGGALTLSAAQDQKVAEVLSAIPAFLGAMAVPIAVGLCLSWFLIRVFTTRGLAGLNAGILTSIALLALMGVAVATSPSPLHGSPLILLAAALGVLIWRNSDELKLCCELLSAAGRALSQGYLRLVLALLALYVTAAATISYCMFTLVAALASSGLGHNPSVARAEEYVPGQPIGTCFNQEGDKVPCCHYVFATWPLVYMALAAAVALWTLFLAVQLGTHIIACLIAQWYYMPPAGEQQEGSTDEGKARRPTWSLRQSICYALTTDFGTAAFGAAIMTSITVISQTITHWSGNPGTSTLAQGTVWSVLLLQPALQSCVLLVAAAAAVTGQPLMQAARDVYRAAKGHFQQVLVVLCAPTLAMTGLAVLLSAALMAALVALAVVLWLVSLIGADPTNAAFSIVLGYTVIYLSMVISISLSGATCLAAGLLSSVVSTLYVLVLLDRDAQRQCGQQQVELNKAGTCTHADHYALAEEGRGAGDAGDGCAAVVLVDAHKLPRP